MKMLVVKGHVNAFQENGVGGVGTGCDPSPLHPLAWVQELVQCRKELCGRYNLY